MNCKLYSRKMFNGCCALCQTSLPPHPILDGQHHFCCAGCHAVFNVLSSQNQLTNYQEQPLFQRAAESGLISNPLLLEEIRRKKESIQGAPAEKFYLEIADLWCPSCAEVIRLVLLQHVGIIKCIVDYATDLACIEYIPQKISKEKIYTLIKTLGYTPCSLESNQNSKTHYSLYLRFIIAAFCSANIMMFAYPLYATYFYPDISGYGSLLAWLSLLFSLPVISFSGLPIFKRCWTNIRLGIYGMETLVTVSVIAAFGLSLYKLLNNDTHVYFDSMAAIITLVLLGKILETKAKASAKESISRLTKTIPRRGRKLLPDGQCPFVPIEEIRVGDSLVIFAGERVVLDGKVINGEASCDESLMTGESIPIYKNRGDSVIAGSIVQGGSLTVQVTNAIQNCTLSRIIHLVEQELDNKIEQTSLVDRIVHWFIPAVLTLSACVGLATWVFHAGENLAQETAILRSISIILIACPCAIGIAVPLVESQMIHALANKGVLVRNRRALAFLGKETQWIFDKTGTITKGKFTVYQGLEKLNSREQQWVKIVTARSSHPIACAIESSIESNVESPGKLMIEPERVEEIAGKGLRGTIQGHMIHLGSALFLAQQGIEISEGLIQDPSEITTEIHVAIDGVWKTVLLLADRLNEHSLNTIKQLRKVKEMVLLSGDSIRPVKAVAQACGFNAWKAMCTPLDKRDYVSKQRELGQVVGMVGDGINDAPALARAHLGISVLSSTETAMQVSDFFLTTDRLSVIPEASALGKRGHRIIKENLFWAFVYNIGGIGLAMAGELSPLFAAFAMTASSLIVLFNARRLT